jgi:hypothetical protein
VGIVADLGHARWWVRKVDTAGDESQAGNPPGSYYVPNPFAIASIGKRNEERLRRSENIHWRAVEPA